jgi:hypothetical protein
MTTQATTHTDRHHQLWLAAAVVSTAVLVVSVLTLVAAPPSGATEPAGELVLSTQVVGGQGAATPVTQGGSGLPIVLTLPSNAGCTGDSSSGQYRVQTFMVPGTVDPGTVKFDSNGPVKPAGAAGLWYSLYSTGGDPVVNRLTDVATSQNGPGLISGLPVINFSVFAPGDITAGSYHVGVACTRGSQSDADQLDRYWAVEMTFADDSGDQPAGVVWTSSPFQQQVTTTTTVVGDTTTTTTSTTTSTTVDSSTTTTTPTASTSTTVDGSGAASTGSGGSTGSSTGGGVTTTGGGAATSASGTGSGSLPVTGLSTLELVGWGLLLLVAGRVAWLFSRRTRVVGHRA